MKEKFIPYGRQDIDEEDIKAVVDVLRSDYLTTGPKIDEFEKKFAEYVGAKYAVAISNGTAALHGACYAAGIGKGDEVITTPITFAASSNAVLYCGGTPVFADIDPKTYNIDPQEIRKKITANTKAIIPVHYTGQPCDMDEIIKIAKEYNLIIIEDAAHGLGADYKGRKIGSIGDMTTFSFHPVKHITTGEGGMITTNDEELYNKLILFRTHGITRDKIMLHNQEEGPWYYEQLVLGYNYRMTDIQCSLGISQLKKLDGYVMKRREIAERYNKAFENIEGMIIPNQAEGHHSSWHLYVIQLDGKIKSARKEIFNQLRTAGLGVNVHYIPVYYFPYYQGLGYTKGQCPKAEEFYEGIITLPLFPTMTDEDIEYVIEKVIKVVKS
ncbi:UDP-4-amino-4,6-dideoxy-N-acetyl-beta-L-altrosamine transaminase [Alkaliphilus hydrothermalis]|uniref:UDP-4-amino-4, 6-dideoxy-N-acetyl-beta-L-altrosamine transaminase n=1 Tax=Alkaliphilus hydrothermalis TaxID=1482730 RepID=A0ABS2NR01_9FIRM|nr:UDP-4-amino-4,6-dideoxy-N-acetyl-beta-L-altrosamine transaminase [Alkaliphilus hydrothermalis]MBM7615382.1 UDP-4-amino-4,6-dideoxy-N-acetyl-beta-L-altrosamine transaminase [Alkaliphilus hydrothermalis]